MGKWCTEIINHLRQIIEKGKNMKFICTFEVDEPDIDYASEIAGEVLKAHLLSLLESKMSLTCEDENDPGIEYVDRWIEEARQMIKTLEVVKK